MRTLVVTPYPPNRDGIAAYAAQYVRRLRDSGQDVRVLSPGPSAAHEHLDLVGPRGALALAKRVRDYDRVVVQFHPDFFYRIGAGVRERCETSAALLAAFRLARSVEVVVHEIDYRHGRRTSPDGLITRQLWNSVDVITVHTQQERDDFAAAFGVRTDRIRVAAHGEHFLPRSFHTRESARESLAIPQDQTVFLSIGFIQPHKGFDRGVRAFQQLGPASTAAASLHVVGSLRLDGPDFVAYADDLRELAAQAPNTHVHVGYLSDELFDRWILAADVVVLPYRNIWSSGVLERARLFDRPVIASAVGGLQEQARDMTDVTLVDSDEALRDALGARLGGAAPAPAARLPWHVTDSDDLRASVQAEVRARAALARGGRPAGLPDALGPPSDQQVVALGRSLSASAPLRRLPGAHLPPSTSARPAARLVKGVVGRLTTWQLAPLVDSVNALQQATIRSVEQVAQSTAPPEGSSGTR